MFLYVYLIGKEGRAIDDEKLILKIRRGERNVFQELVTRYGEYIFKVAFSVLKDEKEAEDAAQETFLQVYKSLPDYRSQGFKTWMTRIALNKAIDLKRKRDRRREERWDPIDVELQVTDDRPEIVQEIMDVERNVELRNKIAALPPGHRSIVSSFYLQGKSYEEIASELHVTVKTVESKLYRARAWMREHWKEEELR
ncbi:ECF RNA polymerase sigma factor SigE [compost metagenome]